MYDRYTIFSPIEDLEGMFSAQSSEAWLPYYNAYPTNKLPIITSKKKNQIQLSHWGLAGKMANNKPVSAKLFNLLANGASHRPIYRKAMQQHRCIILADGFFLWKQVSKKQKIPYFCHYANHMPFAIAGIYEEFEDLDGNLSSTFNMILATADNQLEAYQEDMPAVLNDHNWKDWLDENNTSYDQIEEILSRVSSGKLFMHAVSPRLIRSKYNDPAIISPSSPSDQFGNYTLFS